MFKRLFCEPNSNKQLSIEEQIKLCENDLNLLKKKQLDENEKKYLDLNVLAINNDMEKKAKCLYDFNRYIEPIAESVATRFLWNFNNSNNQDIIKCEKNYLMSPNGEKFEKFSELLSACKFTEDDILNGVKKRFIEKTNINPACVIYIPKTPQSCPKLIYEKLKV